MRGTKTKLTVALAAALVLAGAAAVVVLGSEAPPVVSAEAPTDQPDPIRNPPQEPSIAQAKRPEGSGRDTDETKSDRDTKVAAGKELNLTSVTVTSSLVFREDQGWHYVADIKAAKESKKVTMPKEVWVLGFYPKAVKGGIGIAGLTKDSGLVNMRHWAGSSDGWKCSLESVITHVNGYAVNSVEELLCAVSTAEDKKNVPIVLRGERESIIFFVSATKR